MGTQINVNTFIVAANIIGFVYNQNFKRLNCVKFCKIEIKMPPGPKRVGGIFIFELWLSIGMNIYTIFNFNVLPNPPSIILIKVDNSIPDLLFSIREI